MYQLQSRQYSRRAVIVMAVMALDAGSKLQSIVVTSGHLLLLYLSVGSENLSVPTT